MDHPEIITMDTLALCHVAIEQVRAHPAGCWGANHSAMCDAQGVDPVRKAATATLVWLLRYASRGTIRKAVEADLSSLTLSPAWAIRSLAIHAVGCAVWLFSRAYVKRLFLPGMFELVQVRVPPPQPPLGTACVCPQDPVSLVRERCLSGLVGLRRWMTFPRDVQIITMLEDCCRGLFEEPNPRMADLARRSFNDINTVRRGWVLFGGVRSLVTPVVDPPRSSTTWSLPCPVVPRWEGPPPLSVRGPFAGAHWATTAPRLRTACVTWCGGRLTTRSCPGSWRSPFGPACLPGRTWTPRASPCSSRSPTPTPHPPSS